MKETVEWNPAFAHRMERVELSRRRLSEEDIRTPRKTHHRPQLETVDEAFERLREEYRTMRRKIEVPTTAIAGETDGAIRVGVFAEAASRFIGPYNVVIMPCGHFPHREHPELFLDHLLGALEGP